MYVPAHFALTDPVEIHRILREHPLGLLVTHAEDGLVADHLPFEFDPSTGEHGCLRAHVARANPVWRRCGTGASVLVVFQGVQAYVSPNGYPSKHETHRQVPTWNYETVHVSGWMTAHDDERYARSVVARLTRQHEASEERPWRMGEAPPDYLDSMLSQIVGIEIAVTSLVAKSKLSQNKEPRDRLGAINHLASRGDEAMAERMRLGLPPDLG
jgi:transcriptional regulator